MFTTFVGWTLLLILSAAHVYRFYRDRQSVINARMDAKIVAGRAEASRAQSVREAKVLEDMRTKERSIHQANAVVIDELESVYAGLLEIDRLRAKRRPVAETAAVRKKVDNALAMAQDHASVIKTTRA